MLAAQLCPTLCDSLDCSQPGSFAYRILQARILEWVSISFSRWSSWSGIKPRLPMLQADSLSSEPLSKPSIVKKKIFLFLGIKLSTSWFEKKLCMVDRFYLQCLLGEGALTVILIAEPSVGKVQAGKLEENARRSCSNYRQALFTSGQHRSRGYFRWA